MNKSKGFKWKKWLHGEKGIYLRTNGIYFWYLNNENKKVVKSFTRKAWDITSNQAIGIYHLEQFHKRITWPFLRIVEWPWSSLEIQVNFPFTLDKTHVIGIKYYPPTKKFFGVSFYYTSR